MNEEQNNWTWDEEKTGETPEKQEPKYGQIATPEQLEEINNKNSQNKTLTPSNNYTSSQTNNQEYDSYSKVLEFNNGVIPLKPLSIGDIIDGSFKALRKGFKTYFLNTLLINIIFSVFNLALLGKIVTAFPFEALISQNEDLLLSFLEENTIYLILMLLISVTNTTFVLANSGLITSDLIVGQQNKTLSYLKKVFKKTHILLLLSLLFILLVFFFALISILFVTVFSYSIKSAIFATLIVGLFSLLSAMLLVVRLSFTIQITTVEEKSIATAFARSWKLSSKYVFKVLAVYIITNLLVGVIATVINMFTNQGIALLFELTNSIAIPIIVSTVFSTIVGTIVTPFMGIVYFVLYVDLRIRKEALDLDLQKSINESN